MNLFVEQHLSSALFRKCGCKGTKKCEKRKTNEEKLFVYQHFIYERNKKTRNMLIFHKMRTFIERMCTTGKPVPPFYTDNTAISVVVTQAEKCMNEIPACQIFC